METKKNNRAVIIGIGNLLMKDEGFGIHVIRYLEEHFRLPDDVDLVDAGTAGIYMAPVFEEAKRAIVIDVIALDLAPGTIVQLDHVEMAGKSVTTSMSSHQIGVLEMLEICRFRGTVPEKTDFFCVVPEVIEAGLDLSAPLWPKVEEMAEKVTSTLKKEGYRIEDA